jgi:hypothetical protein
MDAYGLKIVGWFKHPVTAVTSTPYVLSIAESGQVFTNEGASSDVQFNLPTIVGSSDSDYVGVVYYFAKLASSGIIIDAPAGEYVGGSPSGGQLYNLETETDATTIVMSVSDSKWAIFSTRGTWSTRANPAG